MFRYSLRTFLIFCAISGVLLALALQVHWRLGATIKSFDDQTTANDLSYSVHLMTQAGPYGPRRLLNAVIIPARTGAGYSASTVNRNKPHGDTLEIYRNAVFLRGRLIGGFGTSRVLICLDRTDVRVIELTAEETADLDMLDTATPPNVLSRVWRDKVEPQIDRLVDQRRNAMDRFHRQNAGLPP